MRQVLTHAGIGLLWLLHFLPLPLLLAIGRRLGSVGYHLSGSRRRVTLTNLRLCFPDLPEAERMELAKRHFRAAGMAVMGEGVAWWASEQRLRRLVQVEGEEHWRPHRGQPLIWLVPHFLALDVAAIRLNADTAACSMFRVQSNPVVDRLLRKARTRFNPVRLVSRQEGIRPLIGAIRAGLPFYYLPDQDYGPKDAIFVPFFGVPTATISALSRLTRLTGAKVMPVIGEILPGGSGFRVRIYPAWNDFPGESVEADTRRMNAFIEDRVRELPDQYLWLHKRFKTRPPGEPPVY